MTKTIKYQNPESSSSDIKLTRMEWEQLKATTKDKITNSLMELVIARTLLNKAKQELAKLPPLEFKQDETDTN